ncbi:hypothetical protein ACIOHC_36400 [Streptomyces sp. NPDC088252]|uniref:hypothetical protein n=1 Tax=Streptomyces sp. NPDC088252 TaxID=3365845 RepID=UPI0037FFE8D3
MTEAPIEVLAVLDDGENVRNSLNEKAVAVRVVIAGLSERTLVITPDTCGKLYDAVCSE